MTEAEVPRRAMPRQKPGASIQTYGTPWEFIEAVEERFGPLAIDLAADAKNRKAPRWIDERTDSLSVAWAPMLMRNMWLNPPFGQIAPWARKCRDEAPKLRACDRILFLTPASVGANWFWRYVHGHALVLPLSPRLVFDGQPPNPKTGKFDPYPKDLMLSVFGEPAGFERWEWKVPTWRKEAAT